MPATSLADEVVLLQAAWLAKQVIARRAYSVVLESIGAVTGYGNFLDMAMIATRDIPHSYRNFQRSVGSEALDSKWS